MIRSLDQIRAEARRAHRDNPPFIRQPDRPQPAERPSLVSGKAPLITLGRSRPEWTAYHVAVFGAACFVAGAVLVLVVMGLAP